MPAATAEEAAAAGDLPACAADCMAWGGVDAPALVSLLVREDQGHVLAAWRPGGGAEHEAAKRAQLEQVRGLERGYPGGLAAYLRNARILLKQSAAGDNPFEGLRPEVRSEEGSRREAACRAARSPTPIPRPSLYSLHAGALGRDAGLWLGGLCSARRRGHPRRSRLRVCARRRRPWRAPGLLGHQALAARRIGHGPLLPAALP